MKLDRVGRREEVRRTDCTLRWATVLLIATLATGVQQARAGINQWTSLGPYGGAIKTLAIDPQNTGTMYAGTYTGVFKTIDGAASWMSASAGLPVSFPIVSGLAIDPQNTSTLYAWGANFPGLFKSTDSAASWNAVKLPGPFGLSAVAIVPGGATYVSGTVYGENYGPPVYSAILKSLDGGESWLTLRLPDHFFTQKLAIDLQSPNTLYVAASMFAGDPAAVYSTVLRSADGGTTWVEGGRLPWIQLLALDPGSPNALYVGNGSGIYKSADGGASWSAANSGFPDGVRNTLALAVDPGTPGTVYAVMGFTLPQGVCCFGSIFKSTDAAQSWSEVNADADSGGRPGRADRAAIDRSAFDWNTDGDFGPLAVGLAVDPATPGTVYLGTNGDGVFKSTDGGRKWGAANAGLTAMSTSRVAVDPQHGTIYAAGWTRLFKSEDGGLSWHGGNWGAPSWFVTTIAIDPQNPDTIYAGAPNPEFGYGGLFKSGNGGTNWSGTSLRRTGGGVCGIETVVFDPQNPNVQYAGTDWCGLYKSTDRGKTWELLHIWNNRLNFWQGTVGAIKFDPLDSNTIYVAGWPIGGTSCCGPTHIYKSLDGGMTWTPANSGLPDVSNVSALLIDPKTPTTLYAGAVSNKPGGDGLYRSTDGAASWKRIGAGYPLAIDPQNPSILYGVIARGLFRSTNGGGSWTSVNAGLQGSIPGALAFDPLNSNTVYAATDGGVFAITFVR